MKLILITTTKPVNSGVVSLLVEASKTRVDNVLRLNVDQLSISDLRKVETSSKDILYREALGEKARAIEAHFVLRNDLQRPANLRREMVASVGGFQWDDTVKHESRGLPIIPTTYLDETWKTKSAEEVELHVDTLGGFPVILKRTGLSHGQGVQLVENIDKLLSLIAKQHDQDMMNFALRNYLVNYEHARLIVLGDRVVDSIKYEIPNDDFRTNAHEAIEVVEKSYGEDIDSIAVNAAKVSGVEFGGADVLIDLDTKTPYLAEFNFPCNFARAQMLTGKDTAGSIIDYLKNSNLSK